jgi:Dolichyl-phosphate-mannose-protein mannosyltransferase
MSDTARDTLWLALIVLIFVAFGVFFAHYLVSLDTEWGHVVLGHLLVSGQIRPFQDEMVGARLPLAYYVIGSSQLVAGRDLLAARLWSVVLGALTVVSTFYLGRSVAGRTCGFLSALLLATHSVLVGFYAAASHYAVSSLLIAAGLLSIAIGRSTLGAIVGMSCFVGVAFTRAQLAVMAPAVLAYLLFRARTRWERVTLVAIAVVPPAVFFAWNTEHLKVLAYAPLLKSFVTPLGYRALFELGAESLLPQSEGFGGVAWFFKRHFFWVATSALLAGSAIVARWWAPRISRTAMPTFVVFIAALAVFTLGWHVVGFSSFYVKQLYLKPMAAYATGFAPLWAVTLGYGCATLISPGYAPPWIRVGMTAWLLVVFALGPTFSRHAAMPLVLPPTTTISLIDADARTIGSVIPAGQRVFVFGSPIRAYLAGASPYLQQIIHDSTLVPSTDSYTVARSGLWGSRQIDEWLGHDSQYAIVEPALLEAYATVQPYGPLVGRMRFLLEEHFRLVVTVGASPYSPAFQVYSRKQARTMSGRAPEARGDPLTSSIALGADRR